MATNINNNTMKSRLGRHHATASTWLLRRGIVKTREEAVKLVKRGKVKFDGKIVQTLYLYEKPYLIIIKH